MLLELKQSPMARDGLRRAGEEIVELLAQLAAGRSPAEALSLLPAGHRPKAKAVEAIAALPVEERRALRDAVEADLAFDVDFDEPSFEFAFPTLSDATKEAGKGLLTSMYKDVFCRGGGFKVGSTIITRSSWEQSFRDANPRIKVCPACLSARLPRPARGRSLVDADHYLPKSKYPALAVHGLNLVLVCKDCNESLKGDLDPLFNDGEINRLGDVWFPYRRAGLGELILEIAVDARQQTVNLGGTPPALERAQRFDRLFALLERWSETLENVAERLPPSLRAAEAQLNEPAIRREIEKFQRIAEEEITEDERAFIKSHYYRWLLTTPGAFQTLLDEMQAQSEERAAQAP